MSVCSAHMNARYTVSERFAFSAFILSWFKGIAAAQVLHIRLLRVLYKRTSTTQSRHSTGSAETFPMCLVIISVT